MKISEHVDKLRTQIEAAFDKQFARLGIGATKQIDLDKLPSELHKKRQRFEEMLENHVGETGCYKNAREKLLDELTFTLFNRIAAIKVMESASLFPPIIAKQPEHGDRSFGHKAWLEIRPDMRNEELEGIREYIKHAFNELGETLPLYSKEYPYALLPDPISLNEIIDTFNTVEKDSQVEDGIWNSDDILGWLYESYNNAKKQTFKDSDTKTEYDKVSLQSQVYTPRWVVKFLVENSLGKLYLEMYPDSEIKKKYKIANAPKTQERKPKPLHEIKLIDPASGSGNFLLYAFDFFYALYLDQIENYGADYDEEDIQKLIIENNIYGIDLDDRAVQLAQLGLYIKARKKSRSIGNLNFNVVSSDFFLPDYEEIRHIFEEGADLDKTQKELIADIWSDLQYAYKFGSLIRIDEKLKAELTRLIERKEVEQQPFFSDSDLGITPKPIQTDIFTEHDIEEEKKFANAFFNNLKTTVEHYARAKGNTFLTSKTRDAIIFLELLTTEYDVATANPPYTSRQDYGPDLKTFIGNNYREPFDTNVNLYSCFIQRLDQLLTEKGKMAMVTPMTFMFISTFEETRKLLLTKYHINLFVQYGFGGMFSESVDPAMFILDKGEEVGESTFMKFDMYFSESKRGLFSEALLDLIGERNNQHVFRLSQKRILEIISHPFIFWISQDFRDKFKDNVLEDSVKVCVGLQTGQNERFLRFWWELAANDRNIDKKWVGYAKGGAFNMWQGNLWLKVNWENEGYEIKNFFGDNGRLKSRPQNESFYFKEGITYSASGRGGYAFRRLPQGHIFDVGGSSLFPVKSYKNFEYLIAFLNSKLAFYIADCLNPTVNIQVGDLQRVPFILPDRTNESVISTLAAQNIELTQNNLKSQLVEPSFEESPFPPKAQWAEAVKLYLIESLSKKALILINQALINEKIFEVYSLSSKDKKLVIRKQGDDIANYPVSSQGKAFFITKFRDIIGENACGKIKEIPTIEPTDNYREVIPYILKGADLEDISKKYSINPIDILWALNDTVFSQFSKGIAQELAFEFLADLIREILLEDEDGIIPLVPNAGEKVLLDRIEEKFREKGFSSAQYSNFDSVLGRPIHDYLNKYFFAELTDHLNLFSYLPKTPFIWHLSSGPEQGFDCYLIIYKWSRDNLMRLRSVYIEHRERSLINRQSDLANNSSADAQNEKDKIIKQLKEIETFKVKIDDLLAEGYNPILDDGVGKNIAPLQKKKMIPYEVLNAGQLKKYLNADW
jgi:hypothetical protein